MICVRCGAPVEWWPISDHWASRAYEDTTVDLWTFICPERPDDQDPYHQPGESRVY